MRKSTSCCSDNKTVALCQAFLEEQLPLVEKKIRNFEITCVEVLEPGEWSPNLSSEDMTGSSTERLIPGPGNNPVIWVKAPTEPALTSGTPGMQFSVHISAFAQLYTELHSSLLLTGKCSHQQTTPEGPRTQCSAWPEMSSQLTWSFQANLSWTMRKEVTGSKDQLLPRLPGMTRAPVQAHVSCIFANIT